MPPRPIRQNHSRKATTPDTRRRSTRVISQGGASPSAQPGPTQPTIDTNPRLQKGKRKQPPHTQQSAGNSKRVNTKESGFLAAGPAQSGSHTSSSSSQRPTWYRISGIPPCWSEDDLLGALQTIDPSLSHQYCQPSLYLGCFDATKIALLNLASCTEYLEGHKHLPVPKSTNRIGAVLTIDSYFYNFTPLNVPKGEVVAEFVLSCTSEVTFRY